MALAYNSNNVALGGEMMIFINLTGSTSTTAVKPILFTTSASLSISTDTIDITSKDSGNFKSYKTGMLDWEMSSENLYTYALTGATAVAQVDSIVTRQLAQLPVAVKFIQKTGTTPEWSPKPSTAKGFSGTAIITKFDVKAGNSSEAITYSITLKGTDALIYQ